MQSQHLLDVDYHDCSKARLVMDNLNIHSISSLEALSPETARRLAKGLETHYTPKHCSSLNIAEIKLRVMTSPCLNRRICDITSLSKQLLAWESDRNLIQKGVDWQFSTDDARIKLKHLYPQFRS